MLDTCYSSAAEKLRRLLYCSTKPPPAPPFHHSLATLSHRPHEPLCEPHSGCHTTKGPPCRCVNYRHDGGGERDPYRRDASGSYPPLLKTTDLQTEQLSKGAFDVASHLKELQPTEDLLLALFSHSQELDDYCGALKNENDVLQEEVKTLRQALEQLQEARKSKLGENMDMLEQLVQSIEECKLSKEDSAKLDKRLQQHSVTARIEMIELQGRLQQSSSKTRQLEDREKNARARVHEAVLVATEAQLQAEQYANRVKELERELEHERQRNENQGDSS